MFRIKTLPVGQMKTNCYIVSDEKDMTGLIIDPGDDGDFIADTIKNMDINPLMILATHGHFDHNLASFSIGLTFNIPYLISKKDLFLLKKMPASAKHFLGFRADPVPEPRGFLSEKTKLNIGKSFFRVIETPGHTPGSVSFYNPLEKILFCGDLLFKDGSIGRYDFSYSDKKDLFSSLDRVLNLPGDTLVYPGHGEETSLQNAKKFFNKT